MTHRHTDLLTQYMFWVLKKIELGLHFRQVEAYLKNKPITIDLSSTTDNSTVK